MTLVINLDSVVDIIVLFMRILKVTRLDVLVMNSSVYWILLLTAKTQTHMGDALYSRG